LDGVLGAVVVGAGSLSGHAEVIYCKTQLTCCWKESNLFDPQKPLSSSGYLSRFAPSFWALQTIPKNQVISTG
jgi:hypothetical protein